MRVFFVSVCDLFVVVGVVVVVVVVVVVTPPHGQLHSVFGEFVSISGGWMLKTVHVIIG